MNYFAFSGLVNGLISTVCGTVVFLQNRQSRKNQVYALYCLSLAVWGYFYFFWHLATDYQSALFYARALMVGAIFIPTLHYHHIVTLFDMESTARRRWLTGSYLICVIFLGFNFTPYFVADVGPKMMIPYWQIPGPLYHPFLAFFLLQVVLSNRLLWIRWKAATPVVKNEVRWAAIATTIGYTGGCTNFFLQYDIPIPPYLSILGGVYVAIAALLFFRLGLLDVRLVLKHISIILLVYGSLLALLFPAAVPIAHHVLKHPDSNPVTVLLSFGLVIGGVLSIGPFIYAHLIRNKVWLRGNLTDGLAHEMKSPLSAIQSALETIENNILEKKPESETLAYLQMIRKNADRLDRNVGDLLQVAKLRDGEIQTQKAPVMLAPLVQDIFERHNSSAEQRRLHLQFEPNGITEISADSEKIHMVLSNLVSNAIKFSSEGTIKIEFRKSEREVICTVTDQGCGISAEDIPKVFNPFYQGKNATKGSGIGLAVAKSLVEAHGGKIWAESEGEGKGAVMRFTLPL